MAVVPADDEDGVEGPEQDPGDDGGVGEDGRRHAPLADHYVHPCCTEDSY